MNPNTSCLESALNTLKILAANLRFSISSNENGVNYFKFFFF